MKDGAHHPAEAPMVCVEKLKNKKWIQLFSVVQFSFTSSLYRSLKTPEKKRAASEQLMTFWFLARVVWMENHLYVYGMSRDASVRAVYVVLRFVPTAYLHSLRACLLF